MRVYNDNFKEIGVIGIKDGIALALVEKRQQPSSETSGIAIFACAA
jgi:hypothetical protein